MASHLLSRTSDTIRYDDEIMHALGDSRRRAALDVLDEDGEVDLTRLSQQVVISEAETDLTGENLRTVAVELVHKHLPRLDDLEIVEYSHDEQRIERGKRFERIEPYV